jgi:putative lipoprotein
VIAVIARSMAMLLVLGAAVACAGPDQPAGHGHQMAVVPVAPTQVSGTLTYRQRIALPEDAMLNIWLVDMARADAAATVLAHHTFAAAGRQVPLHFTMAVPLAGVAPTMRPGLRATINDGHGRLLWTTDTARPVNLEGGRVDLGLITLVQAAAAAAPAGAALPIDGEWRVREIAGEMLAGPKLVTLHFNSGGRLGGAGPCNTYGGRWQIENGRVKVDQLLSTMMACPPPVGEQERAFLAILQNLQGAQVDTEGALVLTGVEGRRIVARR